MGSPRYVAMTAHIVILSGYVGVGVVKEGSGRSSVRDPMVSMSMTPRSSRTRFA